jgi:hypothetical protein
MKKEDLKYLSKRFGIPEEDIIWFNSGICYSRIQVKTVESANKIRESVKNDTVNGGMLDGMPLGGISFHASDDGNNYFDVTC